MTIENYLSLVTSQHKTRPKFMAELKLLLTLVNADTSDTADNYNVTFDPDKAQGDQLDKIGQIVGLNRILPFQPSDSSDPKMSDYVYRIALKARIIMSHWDGQRKSLEDMWSFLFPTIPCIILNNQDMTMTVVVLNSNQVILKDLLSNNLLIPKPAGVRLNYFYGQAPIFGYGVDSDIVSGYGKGKWLYIKVLPVFAYGPPGENQGGYGTGYWS